MDMTANPEAAGLDEITLSFTRSVRITLVSCKREVGASWTVPAGALPKAFVEKVSLDVPPLEPGSYYIMMSANTVTHRYVLEPLSIL